ncbi:MAG: monomeric [FeFe] hydrogenase [Clostridiales bacterium]|nr:monomeric [FeFe] hydrogenase [Clostridiales bacterium]
MENRLFDTTVQKLKYEVIKELIIAYDKGLDNGIFHDIPIKIMPGPHASLRCCVYKERAILQERLKLAMGGDKDNPNVVEVIDIACDECPVDGIFVTPACRGCISHRCIEACPKNAISIEDKHAVVDKSKCIECGKCTQACPYNAMILQKRPCVLSCKANAIKVNADKKAVIDVNKCVGCGACVYQCPFGAISDKSYILDALEILKNSENNTKYKVYAIIAPAIVAQFNYARIEQVITGMHKLGFDQVVETALGADLTLNEEADEIKEKGTLTTSCCPSFVKYVKINFPDLYKYVSHTPSPMVMAGKLIKAMDPTAKVIFVGPCTSKKFEYKQDTAKDYIDCVISFEELQAFLDARGVDVSTLPDTYLDNASYYGRIFARSGGITEGVKALAAERGFEAKPIAMSGLDECRKQLTLLKVHKSPYNFFEGMACDGGCVNGALCLHHGPKSLTDVNKYGEMAKEKTVDNSVKLYKMAVGEKDED